MMENINQTIENQVQLKIAELSSPTPTKWEGRRLFYEAKGIKAEFARYGTATQILYLENLLAKTYCIQDRMPSCAPDITKDFKKWLRLAIATLKKTKTQL